MSCIIPKKMAISTCTFLTNRMFPARAWAATALKSIDATRRFYCNGVKCAHSSKATNIMLDCGYANIDGFRGNFGE